MASNRQKAGLQQLIEEWSQDAELFVREALQVEKIYKHQREFLKQLTALVNAKIIVGLHPGKATEEQKELAKKIGISIMSGKGPGKDTVTSWAILWFLTCFPRPKIPCTAPTNHQLRDILWAEAAKWLRNAENKCSEEGKECIVTAMLEWQAEKIYLKELKGEQWFAVARTCNAKASPDEQAETLQGFHEDFMMIVADEASGIPDPVFRPLETTLTGLCNFMLCIFNPTKNTGFAIDTQFRDRSRWICLHWNTEECENVSRDQIQALRDKYGVDSNMYRISVLGLPPKADDGSLIPWEWIQAAADRWDDCEPLPDDVEKLVLDVGGGGDGDPSVKTFIKGIKVLEVSKNESADTMEITTWYAADVKSLEPDSKLIDINGIGRGVFDRLKQLGISPIGINTSNSAKNIIRFVRLRDELWWLLREDFESGNIAIPRDEELIGELSTIRYDKDINGKIKVESKKEMRKRGLKSPNKADCLMMSKAIRDNSVYSKGLQRKAKDSYDKYFEKIETPKGWMAV